MAISESLVTSVYTDVTEGKLFCLCWENECTCVHVKCHTNAAHVCFYYKVWGSHCIYWGNMAYIRYSYSLAIDSIWYYLFSQTLFLSRILSIQTLNNTFIQFWLSKINQKLLQHISTQTNTSLRHVCQFWSKWEICIQEKEFNLSLTFPFHPPHWKKKKCKQFRNTALRK